MLCVVMLLFENELDFFCFFGFSLLNLRDEGKKEKKKKKKGKTKKKKKRRRNKKKKKTKKKQTKNAN